MLPRGFQLTLSLVLLLVADSESKCDTGWVEHKCDCFLFVGDRSSFDEAKENCESVSASLVSIHSRIKNDFIKDMITESGESSILIGLYRNETEKPMYSWTDRSAIGYSLWDVGQPDNSGDSGERCTEFRRNGMWHDVPCHAKYPYICQRTSEKTICDQGWVDYDCRSYLLVEKELDFWDAYSACRNMSANLVSIENQEQNDFIKELLIKNGKTHALIGFYNTHYKADAKYWWWDYTPTTYTNWRKVEPHNQDKSKFYVYINDDGTWSGVNRTESPFICRKTVGPELDSLEVHQSNPQVKWSWKTLGDDNNPPTSCIDHLVLKIRYNETVLSEEDVVKGDLPVVPIGSFRRGSQRRTRPTNETLIEHIIPRDKTSHHIINLCQKVEYFVDLYYVSKDSQSLRLLRSERSYSETPELRSLWVFRSDVDAHIKWSWENRSYTNNLTSYCIDHLVLKLRSEKKVLKLNYDRLHNETLEVNCFEGSETWKAKEEVDEYKIPIYRTSHRVVDLCPDTFYTVDLYYVPKDNNRLRLLQSRTFRTASMADLPSLNAMASLSSNDGIKIIWTDLKSAHCTTHCQIKLFRIPNEESAFCSVNVPAEISSVNLVKYWSCLDHPCHLSIEGMMDHGSTTQIWTTTLSQKSSEDHTMLDVTFWIYIAVGVLLLLVIIGVAVCSYWKCCRGHCFISRNQSNAHATDSPKEDPSTSLPFGQTNPKNSIFNTLMRAKLWIKPEQEPQIDQLEDQPLLTDVK